MTRTPVIAYIGLGANLAEPVAQLRTALAALGRTSALELLAVSPLYRNPPMGPEDQPDYVNAVAAVRTSLSPEALLDILQAIENEQGRVRRVRWGARTLDLDLLLYGQISLATPRLTVPHAGLKERAFVLKPLADIAADLVLPDGATLTECLAAVDCSGLIRIDD